jgi:hypothetical protein
MLAGNATTSEAADPTVVTSPITGRSTPKLRRYRLKSIHHKLTAEPEASVTRRNSRASRSNPVRERR